MASIDVFTGGPINHADRSNLQSERKQTLIYGNCSSADKGVADKYSIQPPAPRSGSEKELDARI
jgi:hypothetical protein